MRTLAWFMDTIKYPYPTSIKKNKFIIIDIGMVLKVFEKNKLE